MALRGVLRCLSHVHGIQSTRFCLLLFGFAPLLAEFFEFVWAALLAMLLHRDVRIEVVEGTVSLCAVWPRASVEAFDFVVAPAWTLFDGVSRQRNERVLLGAWG